MTDAREIIADELKKCVYPADPWANAIINRLHSTRYRIAGPEDRVIGKGELDPVTVARIEEMADAMTDEYDVAAITAETEEMTVACRHAEKALRRLAAAIRALGRKA